MTDTVLLEHGTAITRLKPQNIVQAAEADLKLLARKVDRRADPMAMYSFARRHVRKARSTTHLIAIAYFEITPPTDKRSSMIIYRDRELLRDALLYLLLEEERDGRDGRRRLDPGVPAARADTGAGQADQAHHGAPSIAQDQEPAQAGDEEDAFGTGRSVR